MQEVCSISVKQIEPVLSSIVLLRDLVCTKNIYVCTKQHTAIFVQYF